MPVSHVLQQHPSSSMSYHSPAQGTEIAAEENSWCCDTANDGLFGGEEGRRRDEEIFSPMLFAKWVVGSEVIKTAGE